MHTRFRLTLIAAAVFSTTAYADEAPNNSATHAIGERIQVDGNRLTTAKPDSVIVNISADTIANTISTDIADALRYEPGVTVTRDERFGIGSINIRGLDGNRVKLLVDGVEMADSYGPTTTYLQSGRNSLDTDALQAMEIVKGGDVSAGSGAFGGVVRFNTKQPQDYLNTSGDDSYFSLAANYRSDSERFSETATLANRTGDIESLLVYTRRDGQERENHGGGSDVMGVARGKVNPGDNSSDNLLGKLIWQLDGSRIGVTGEYFKGTSEIDLFSQSTDTTTDRSDDELTRYRIGVFQDITQATAMYDSLHWQLDYQKNKTTNGTHLDSAVSQRFVDRFYDQKGWQGSVKLVKQLGDHQLSYGGNYQYQEFANLNKDTVNNATDTSRFSPPADGNKWGVYLADHWQLTDNFALLPAVRYDRYHYSTSSDQYIADWGDSRDDKLTGQLGFDWHITEQLSMFGRYGSGFRAPAMTELYYYYEHSVSFGGMNMSYIIRPNPDLEPENSTFAEAGLRWASDIVSAELTVYDNHYRNFIASQVSQGSSPEYMLGQFTSLNLDKVEIKGAELRGSVDLAKWFGYRDGLRLDAAFAYAEGDNVGDDQPLDSVAPMELFTALKYDSANNWGGSLTASWTAKKKTSDITDSKQWLATDSFTVVDLTAYVEPINNLRLTAGVFNLFDKEYLLWNDIRNLSNNDENLYRYTQPGRNFGVGIKYSF
ncbi:TonB-dependent hemoglobin/transferrin/lactoferrin family receptor [Shewanella sp. A3A]|nr:TonB-dependent hemoglobin/transferrin/lactoferrin family receptor [Shewanella ferrihydritica]